MNQSDTSGTATNGYSTSNRLLLGISAGFALSYLICIPLENSTALVVIKGMGVSLLAVVAWFRGSKIGAGLNGRLLALALLISSLGDVFLGIDRVGLFVQGLGSFMVAHLIYIALFLRLWPKGVVIDGRQRALIALFILYGLALGGWMMPNLGAHTVPVLVYAAVICSMGVACVLVRFGNGWVLLGAVSFISSDTAIAVDKFMVPLEGIGWYIWPSYYIGQLLIMVGVLAHLKVQHQTGPAQA